jgi:hypothetical protein
MVVANNKIDDDKKYTSNAGNFDRHADTAVQCRAHCLMECTCGFMQNHLMPPSGECPRGIAPAAAMVNNFKNKENHYQNTTST